jgi:hypothetical protein
VTARRDPARDAHGDGPGDPLGRVGRQLIAAERELRHRRARVRIAAGSLGGVALLAALAAIALPGAGGEGPAPGGARVGAGPRGVTAPRGVSLPRPSLGNERVRSVELKLRGGATANATVVARVRARLARTGLPVASVHGRGMTVVVELGSGRTDTTFVSGVFASRALSSGRVAVYDWERSVIGPDGRSLADEQRDGAPAPLSEPAGDARHGLSAREAKAIASLAGPGARTVAALPSASKRPHASARYYVLRGEPALTGADITGAVADSGSSGEPAVTYTLSPDGQQRLHALTRALSERGQRLVRPNAPPATAAQHMAIVVDGRLLAVSTIDPTASPDGIDGAQGVTIAGGWTLADAKQIAHVLATSLPPLGGFAMKLAQR